MGARSLMGVLWKRRTPHLEASSPIPPSRHFRYSPRSAGVHHEYSSRSPPLSSVSPIVQRGLADRHSIPETSHFDHNQACAFHIFITTWECDWLCIQPLSSSDAMSLIRAGTVCNQTRNRSQRCFGITNESEHFTESTSSCQSRITVAWTDL